MNTVKNIAVVGGSIAGIGVALVLERLGYNVTVFERARALLDSKGAGIMLPSGLLQSLISDQFIAHDVSYIDACSRQFIITESNGGADAIWSQPVCAASCNWSDLYRGLHGMLSANRYKLDHDVVDVVQDPQRVQLVLANGKRLNYDWVFACDGVNSAVRQRVFPNTNIEDSGYIAWRGLLPQAAVSDVDIDMFSHVNYFTYRGGHALTYWVPDTSKDSKLLNWLIYERCNGPALRQRLTGKDQRYNPVGLRSDLLTRDHGLALDELLQNFPQVFQRIVVSTGEPFLQNIIDMRVPDVIQGRISFVGDAAMVNRPHSASGATTALQASLLLQKHLKASANFLQSIAAWRVDYMKMLDTNYILSQHLGEHLVMQVPDWQHMSNDDMQQWWDKLMQEFNWYLTDDA